MVMRPRKAQEVTHERNDDHTGKERTYAVIAEFAGPNELLHAAEKVRDAGYKKFDCPLAVPDSRHGCRDGDEGQSKVGYIAGTAAP